MEKRFITDLNNSIEQTWAYLVHTHSGLLGLCFYENIGSYESSIESLFQDFYFHELLNNEWGDCLSDKTRESLNVFYASWWEYIKNTSYGESCFVFYDVRYQEIIRTKLIPAINLLEDDLDELERNNDFVLKPLKRKPIIEIFQPENRPNNEDLLWRVSNLYSLLLKHDIIDSKVPGVKLN